VYDIFVGAKIMKILTVNVTFLHYFRMLKKIIFLTTIGKGKTTNYSNTKNDGNDGKLKIVIFCLVL